MMGLVAFLATRIKLPPWAVEVLLGALLVLAIWLSGIFHEKGAETVRIIRQQVQVEKRVVETDHSHDQELADLRAYRDAHPLTAVRLCNPPRLPERPAERLQSTHGGDVQPLPSGDSSLRAEPGPDISGLLELLAGRADEVSADLRRRQELEP